MTFPNPPYGQGFPDQSGYPQPSYTQQPGFPPILGQPQPGYPQPGYPQPGYPGGQQPYPAVAAEPSGVTGMIAGVLAALGAFAGLVGGVGGVIGLGALSSMAGSAYLSGGSYALMIVVLLFNFVFSLMIGIGAVMLFQRKMLGRWLVVGASILAILSGLLSFGVSVVATSKYSSGVGGGWLSLVTLIFPIATIVLAMVPATTEWIRAKPNPIALQQYPPQAGWS